MADVLEDLTAATGGHARAATDDDAVAGVMPSWVASPGTADEAAALMRAAAAHDLTLVARGTGTKLGWGAPPEHVDVVVDTTRMDQVVEHAAGDLIVVVGAGRRLADLQAELGDAGQRVGIDPTRSGTVGGAVATAATGPTRLFHGAVRDLVIGMRFVRPDGVVAHAGGKVVKNVAGYDLGKVLTGSFGTLGLITEVAFRLHPLPEAQRWVTCAVDGPSDIQQHVLALVHSQLVPAAVELDRSRDGASLGVLLEGIAPGVEQRVTEVRTLLGAAATDAATPPEWWGTEPATPSGVLLKVTHEIGRFTRLLEALDAAADSAGLATTLRGSPAVGTALVGVGAPSAGGAVSAGAVRELVDELRRRATTFGGSVVVLDAPPQLREGLDVWGPVTALDLMRSVKQRFDPERRLAPGRFVGGI
ncbi:glycolate oxidase [Intrasporangium chromatireducens Q5-1]|uniref:Glycolate oxidase n=2 Tax=Intrasporangium TaxID=53357 RepID=W9GF15_9MICO|nr:glycolate oxidase [Intrasporangium chromatireducens Q5-1]